MPDFRRSTDASLPDQGAVRRGAVADATPDGTRSERETGARQQAAAADFGRDALGRQDLDALMNDAAEIVARVLATDSAAVLELLPNRRQLLFRAAFGPWPDDTIGIRTVAADRRSLPGYAIANGEPVVVADVEREPRFAPAAFWRAAGRSAVTVPIGDAKETFGALAALSRERRGFTDGDVAFVRSVANVVAAAVVRIRLDEALRRTSELLENEIAERNRAAARLEENERRLEFLLNDLPVAIAALDRNRTIVRANPAVARILRISGAESFGDERGRRFLRSDGSPMPMEELASTRVLGGENEVRDVEMGIVNENGETIWTSVSAVAAPFEDWRALVVATDITERKRAEQAVRATEERFRQYFELELIGIAVTSPDKQWIEVNDELCRMFGYSREELEARTWADLTYPDDLPLDQRQFDELLAGRRDGYSMEKRYVRKDGRIMYALLSVGGVRRGDGTLDYAIGVIQDVTERKRAEAALARSERRLRALSRRLIDSQENERRHVARELHDEIGQTLTAVKIAVEAAARRRGSNALGDAVGIVDAALERVRDLSMTLRPAMLDDLGLVATLQWYFDSVMRHAGITCRYDFQGADERFDPELEITCFRVAQEAVTNIVRHARAKNVFVTLAVTRHRVDLTISDDGGGFAVRPSGRPDARRPSTGLSAMRERVHLAGGTLTIRSTKGKGTTIRVRLPRGTP